MNRTETTNFSRTTKLLGSLLLAVAFNLGFAYALGSVPTQAQRYAQAHLDSQPALAQVPVIGRHRSWYA